MSAGAEGEVVSVEKAVLKPLLKKQQKRIVLVGEMTECFPTAADRLRMLWGE